MKKINPYVIPGLARHMLIKQPGVYAREIARQLDVDYDSIRNGKRYRPLVDARRIIAFIMVNQKFSTTLTGKAINRDHATVLHYVKTTRWLLRNDPDFATKHHAFIKKFVNIGD